MLLEWDENSYAKLGEAERQETLLLESTFGAINFFGQACMCQMRLECEPGVPGRGC